MAIIDKIKLSGQTFEIQDSNASKTVELTQAEYDALATKDPNTYYIITDATPIDITNYYTKTQTDDLLDDKLDVTAYTPTDLSNYYTKSETSGATQIQTALNGKADNSTVNSLNNVVTAHTADTTVHVTAQDKSTWNNKSDFSGNYNDLSNKPTIPTVPTSNTAFTNDAGYITSDDITGKTNQSDFTAHTANTTVHVTANEKSTWNSKSDFSGDYNDLSNKLSGGTLINISNNKINCSAPIRYGTGNNSVIVGSTISTNKATGMNSIANGGDGNTASGQYSFAEGFGTQATKHSSHSEGWFTIASGNYSHTEGNHTKTTNESEHSSGKYNVSSSASTTFGDSGNTLFSVGNGASDSARHNAFEIRQNGDIYLTLDGQDVKLQDQLGGGSSYTAGDGIDITNDVISVTGKADTSAVTEVSDALTTHTADTTVHVTANEKSTWNNKSDFSGNYNDLSNKPTIPTVPTSNTAFTNDAGYITSDDISGKADTSAVTEVNDVVTAHTADTTIHVTSAEKATWNAKSDFSGDYNDLTNKLSAGTNITIVDNVISAEGGGGKAVTAGTNISVTTGETADTINCTLPIRTDGNYSGKGIILGSGNNMRSRGATSIVGGDFVSASTNAHYSVGFGNHINLSNEAEFGCGEYSKTNRASSTFGDSGNTLFSVGNGTADNARHNAFEIRQNGDIYLNDGSKLQDTVSATTANTTALGGLSLVKLTQAEYDSLVTKDNSTLYVIIN